MEAKPTTHGESMSEQPDVATAYTQEYQNRVHAQAGPYDAQDQPADHEGPLQNMHSKHISDQYQSIASNLPMRSSGAHNEAELSKIVHQHSSCDEQRPQSRGRTSGGFFEPGSVD